MKLFTRAAAIVFPMMCALNVTANDIVEQDYTINDVLELHVSSGIKLMLTQGETESLTLKAPANMLKRIHVDLTNNKLRLNVDSDFSDVLSLFNKEEIVFTMVLKNIELIDLSGGVEANVGNLTLEKLVIKTSGGTESKFTSLQIKNVDIEASGGSEVNVGTMNNEQVRLRVSGGSDFELKDSGSTNTLIIDAGGGSDCNAKKLASITAEVVAGGASDVDVRASKTLNVSAGGASEVNYYGKPSVSSRIGGASELSSGD